MTSGVSEPCHDVVIVGAGAAGVCAATALRQAGITEFTMLDEAQAVTCPCQPSERLRSGREVIRSAFDDDTDTWRLTTGEGEIWHSRIVVAAHKTILDPWIPPIRGRNEFRGVSFHSAAWEHGYDPAGQRVAVVGADSAAGRCISWLTESAASVTVFAYPPRRIVPRLPGPTTRAKRWIRRAGPLRRTAPRTQRAPLLVRSSIDSVTASGIRTDDGCQHEFDAIIYGTGFSIAERVPDDTLLGAGGMTIRQAWQDGMEPYLGAAMHGFPNYFFLTGPPYDVPARHIAACLTLMQRLHRTRIEVRRSSQHVFNERVHVQRPAEHFVASAFDSSSGGDDDSYDGPALLSLAEGHRQVRVRLDGYFDPIDGRYHWQGTVFDRLPGDLLKRTRIATLAVGERSAPARIAEETPQGTHTITGVGTPPFLIDDSELAAPQP